jgi:hypothetical protein
MYTEKLHITIKNIFFSKLKTPSIIALILITTFSIFTFKYWITWNGDNQFSNDIDQYYSYIIAGIVYNDFTFHIPHTFWLTETPIHTYVPKGTMGLSLLYLPWFLLADCIAHLFDYNPDGYSSPYAWCIHLGSILYVIIGFWYLRKTLLIYFSEWITTFTLFSILFATNLFFYTYRETEMPHSYLFFLFSIFFFNVVNWYHHKKIKYLYYFSFIAGFVALIRPTDVLILIIPFLWEVSNFKELKNRLSLFISLKWKLLLAVFLFIIPFLPQLVFWKIYAGQFLFFSYGGNEGFFFLDPEIFNVLFSWRKGWFVYSPIMILSVVGLFFMFKNWKPMFWPITIYMILNLYIISCWWDWGFGGGFGMRALVQSYAFMAFPFAFLLKSIVDIGKMFLKRISIIVVAILSSLFICINVFQNWQVKNYFFHWDGMTKEAYFYTLFKINYTSADRQYLETLIKSPNYQEFKKGNRNE